MKVKRIHAFMYESIAVDNACDLDIDRLDRFLTENMERAFLAVDQQMPRTSRARPPRASWVILTIRRSMPPARRSRRTSSYNRRRRYRIHAPVLRGLITARVDNGQRGTERRINERLTEIRYGAICF